MFAWLLLETFLLRGGMVLLRGGMVLLHGGMVLLRGDMERAQVCWACSSLFLVTMLSKSSWGLASRPHLALVFFQRPHLEVLSTYALGNTGI